MTSPTSMQTERGFMVYPKDGLRKAFFKAPLYLWRMGLGFMLPPNFIVLGTTGRKSGLPRYTMVEHSDIDGTIYIASGWGQRPQWVKNIEADPVISTESWRGGVVNGTARRVTEADEFSRMWEPMQKSPVWETWLESWGIDPNLEDFIAKRDRVVVFAVDPGDVPAPPPLEKDLRWVPFFVGGMLLMKVRRGGRKKRVK